MPPVHNHDSDDSDSGSSIGYIDGFDEEDEDSLPKVIVIDEAKKTVDHSFSPGQLRYLQSLKVEYLELKKEKKPEYALKVAGRLIKQMQKHGMAKDEKAKAQKVRLWLQQNCRAKKDMPRWARAWTGRWVYYHDNPDVVRKIWAEIRRANGEDVPEFAPGEDDLSDEDEEEGDDTEGQSTAAAADEETGGSSTPVRPPVGYFQQALSAAWNALPRSIQNDYDRKAMLWRLDGPSEDMQKILAEKDLPRIALHFAETVFKQMGVRVLMLVTYTDTEQSTVCSAIDYNGKVSLGGRPFLAPIRKRFDESGVMGLWGAYAKETVVTKSETEVDPNLVRRIGKPLLKMELNRYGEPRIPNPARVPAGEQPNQYLPQVIRNVVIYNYARSCGKEPNRTVPPWSDIVGNLRSFISEEYLPESLAINFKEPSAIKVGAARAIILFWRERQAEKKIPLNIHSYIDDSGALVPRMPREPLDGSEDLQSDYRDSEDEADGSSMKAKLGRKERKDRREMGHQGGRSRAERFQTGETVDRDLTHTAEKPKAGRKQGKAPVRRVVDSDEEDVQKDLVPGPLGSPFDTPPPDTVPPSPTTDPSVGSSTPPIPRSSMLEKTGLPAGYLEAELAGLSEDVKQLVLGALQKHGSTVTGPENPINLSLPPPTVHVGSSTLPIKPPTTPLATVPQDPYPFSIKQSDSPVPTPAVLAPSVSDVPNPKSRRKGKASAPVASSSSDAPERRRRRTEEEVLIQMAESAGAKSGRRQPKKSSKLRN